MKNINSKNTSILQNTLNVLKIIIGISLSIMAAIWTRRTFWITRTKELEVYDAAISVETELEVIEVYNDDISIYKVNNSIKNNGTRDVKLLAAVCLIFGEEYNLANNSNLSALIGNKIKNNSNPFIQFSKFRKASDEIMNSELISYFQYSDNNTYVTPKETLSYSHIVVLYGDYKILKSKILIYYGLSSSSVVENNIITEWIFPTNNQYDTSIHCQIILSNDNSNRILNSINDEELLNRHGIKKTVSYDEIFLGGEK